MIAFAAFVLYLASIATVLVLVRRHAHRDALDERRAWHRHIEALERAGGGAEQ